MSFDDTMKNLKLKYLKDLKSKLDCLIDFQGKIKNNHEELRTFFHQLKGSGTTYGVPKISEIGKSYEDKVKTNTLSNEDLITAKNELQEVLENHLS